jgi:Lar family restriction alleviation protein
MTFTEEQIKLKPCPFCGNTPTGDGRIENFGTDENPAVAFAMFCEKCGAKGPIFNFQDDDTGLQILDSWETAVTKANLAWNVRTPDVEAMHNALKGLCHACKGE